MDNAFLVLDISNPFEPEIIGSCQTHGEPFSVAVNDTVACIADGQYGMQIIDISDLSNPERIGYHETSRNGDAVECGYDWKLCVYGCPRVRYECLQPR